MRLFSRRPKPVPIPRPPLPGTVVGEPIDVLVGYRVNDMPVDRGVPCRVRFRSVSPGHIAFDLEHDVDLPVAPVDVDGWGVFTLDGHLLCVGQPDWQSVRAGGSINIRGVEPW